MTPEKYARIITLPPPPLTFGAIKEMAAKADPDILPVELVEKPGTWVIRCQIKPSSWIQEWVDLQRPPGCMIFWEWPTDIVERLKMPIRTFSDLDRVTPETSRPLYDLHAEAASEILRLRAELTAERAKNKGEFW